MILHNWKCVSYRCVHRIFHTERWHSLQLIITQNAEYNIIDCIYLTFQICCSTSKIYLQNTWAREHTFVICNELKIRLTSIQSWIINSVLLRQMFYRHFTCMKMGMENAVDRHLVFQLTFQNEMFDFIKFNWTIFLLEKKLFF